MTTNTNTISIARTTLRKRLKSVFQPTSEGFALLFREYDTLFFGEQLRLQLAKTQGTLSFDANATLDGEVMNTIQTTPHHYRFSFDPANFRVFQAKAIAHLLSSFGCRDELTCIQMLFEHELIHFAMILWGYASTKYKDQGIYGPHGTLFACMLNLYFGHPSSISEHNMNVEMAIETGLPQYGYHNYANSCYIDSLLIILFLSSSDFWRKIFLHTNNYGTAKVCDIIGGSTIDTVVKTKALAISVQNALKEDYYRLVSTDIPNQTCTPLRKLLQDCLPAMTIGELYNPGATYSLLTELFPDSKIDIPSVIYRQKLHGFDVPKFEKEAQLTMWDYMDPHEGGMDDYKDIDFTIFDSPVLVFYNGGVPRIKIFNKTGPEDGYNIIGGVKYPFQVTKKRAFGEEIIDGRYRLIGVVVLHGVSDTSEGGAHYTCYFSSGREWYSYNDVGAKIQKIKALPILGVWQQGQGKMPQMYFYQKVKDAPQKNVSLTSYEGKNLTLQITQRPDDYYFLVVKDKSRGRIMGKIDALNPTTMLSVSSRLWRLAPNEIQGMVAKIKQIDASS